MMADCLFIQFFEYLVVIFCTS